MRGSFTVMVLLALSWGMPAAAQQGEPTEPDATIDEPRGLRIALLGFGVRAGADFTGENQVVAGVTLDLGDLYLERLRIRPSGEIGFANAADNNYLASMELVYRFMPDTERAIPYVGIGLGLWGQQRCGQVDDCPALWPQFSLGFEIELRQSFNWLLEYRGEDGLSRHRFMIGLATRRGP